MIIELGVGLLAVGTLGAVGYAVHWKRERARWAKIREGQLRRLKRLKKKFERGE